MSTTVKVGDTLIGGGAPLVLIAGPCVVESEELTLETAKQIKQITARLQMPFIFKSSYAKANRMSIKSFSGLGIDEGLRILNQVKSQFNVPILTDVHSVSEVEKAAQVADLLQIPAFLCRQTDLAIAVGRTGKPVNIKKGQFLAPEDMGPIAEKIRSTGNDQIVLTERGTCFGYHNLVVDMRSLVIMKRLGYPVVFDATHSVQLPGGGGGHSGGQPEFIPPLARAATAVGVDGVFIETHPSPARALSDASCMLPLEKLEQLLRALKRLDKTRRSLEASQDYEH
ncbi:MAG: 3-deoxy-8-phosphooctulonate synthase [Candidatus Latescibacteria bacterium 4484_181]|nr:MAG: 3-deoxy-8-phosphooctulonate synthase [Candidatus Latescibacteria bacterium 4484_181]RKY67113.1 MAG: 3-deoxy-8-phosphooctulonate synthase [Candidatus Latescibacterota bacterium]RKY72730.1 MAG: 3-deoxy-8-phosphooctulonate synthase [Candidatus Latescibacterota bacterium]